MRGLRRPRALQLVIGLALAAGLAASANGTASGRSASTAPRHLCDAAPAVVNGVPRARCDAEFIPVPASVSTTPRRRAAPATSCGTYFVDQGQGKSPCDILHAYNLPGPSTASASQVIGIVDAFDNPNITSELSTFDALYGLPDLPTCASDSQHSCFQKLNQSGGSTPPRTAPPDDDWQPEISLDVESAHAVCPNCKILLVEANSDFIDDLAAAVATAEAHGATVISNSYGAPETALAQSDYNAFSGAYDRSVPVFASAGDSGWGAQFPADGPHVISVGGTSLTTSGGTRTGESVWSGTGSGCSRFAAAEPWQTMTSGWAATGCVAKRSISDVSADADPATGLIIFTEGNWYQYGGTSLSSPLIAAMYALAANGATATHPAASPYWNPSAFHDITSGSNGSCGGKTACTAGPGYDGPTGIGTPNGVSGFAPVDTTPTIASFAPTSGVTGTQVTITGGYLGDATSVTIGGTATSFTSLSAGQLRVTIPAAAAIGTFSVTTPDGTVVSAGAFGVLPQITGMTPRNAVPGKGITLTGSGLLDVSRVTFAGGASATITNQGANMLVVTVPVGARTGPITVVSPSGAAQSPGFKLIAPPSRPPRSNPWPGSH